MPGEGQASASGSKGPYVLLQAPSEWGLPSSDARCNVAQALLRFSSKIAYSTEDTVDSARESQGRLPVLKAGNDVILRENLNEHFKEVFGINGGLSKENEADITAYSSLVEEKLGDAMMYYAWADEDNFRLVTRPSIASQYSFPLSLYVPRFTRTRMRSMLAKRGLTTEEKAEAQAQACIRALSDRLGSRKYLVGDKPTTLDALVWGYLITFYFAPYPNKTPRKLVESFTNIKNYIESIRVEFFGSERPPPPALKASWTAADQYREQQERWEKNPTDPFGTGGKVRKQRTEKEKAFKRRAKIFVATGVASVLAYALFSDAIQISLDDIE